MDYCDIEITMQKDKVFINAKDLITALLVNLNKEKDENVREFRMSLAQQMAELVNHSLGV